MHPGNLRKPFNLAGPFVARRKILVAGAWRGINEWVPHEGVSERRLQQLFDARKIDMGTEDDIRVTVFTEKAAKKPKIDVPVNWRQLVNRELFPMVKRLLGAFPKNRMEAFQMMSEIDGSA